MFRSSHPVRVYSTCPPSNQFSQADYLSLVRQVARWSEECGCEGVLVYTDHGLVDPWLVAQQVIEHTGGLRPLVAVQPVYMHPFTAAKMVASLGHLHRRRVALNLVAGGFKTDLDAFHDPTPHDRRYARLVEYATVIQRLLSSRTAVSYEGEFYRVTGLKLAPELPADLLPELFVSGSSEAGQAAAAALGALAVEYPRPAGEYGGGSRRAGAGAGVRVGIIAREDPEEAWRTARGRFPEDRRGQIAHRVAMKVSDSVWHRQLSGMAGAAREDHPYWLVPFENYKTFCPYLVGGYERVAEEVARYIAAGYETFILDVPTSPDELQHTMRVFDHALQLHLP